MMNSGKDKIKDFISKDSRRCERISIPVNLFYSSISDTEWIGPQFVEDVGGDGLRFRSNTEIAENTELRLKMNLTSDDTPIIFMGKVARCENNIKTENLPSQNNEGDYSIGVKFYKMDQEDRQRYVNFICGKIVSSYFNDEDEEP
ncbi:MAG: PilZ domain-containing protein [Candidatus Scalindua sp.]|nr:PilZ domain-containing protein [Candidatus Scalindua sp.]